MASETDTARLVHAQFGIEFDDETRRAYERLDKLADAYRSAQDRYAETGSDKDKKAYRDAKQKFATARREQRLLEEDREGHPRGTSLVHVTDGEN